MSLHQVNSAFNLLGQVQEPLVSVHLPTPASSAPPVSPTLNIPWGAFRQSLGSNLAAVFSGPSYARNYVYTGVFKDAWIEGRIPLMAIAVALLLHVVIVLVPFPRALTAVHRNPALENLQLTWSGPIEDLPLLNMPSAQPKSPSRNAANRHAATTPPGEAAFHPRQRIFTDAPHPTHPRQTLINPAAPAVAPKLLPTLPNIVELQQFSGPARPHLQIDKQALAKLHPREHRVATATAPPPDVPVVEPQQTDLTIQASASGPARPKLELNAGAAPRMAPRAQSGDPSVAPEIAEQSAGASPATLIALSAAPAAPSANVAVPAGNLSARVAISPEGKPGAAGTNSAPAEKSGATAGSGSSPVTVSISGGNPSPKTNVSGLGGTGKPSGIPSAHISLASPHDMLTHRPSSAESEEAVARTGPPNFAALPPGAKPEQVFNARKVYTLYVNMPNLNSATGSWILNFSELSSGATSHLAVAPIANPTPIKKVDPKYPPTLASDHVEGEIVLYAIIRRDGSIDSIQLVRSLDPVLDANSISALKQWKFRPATRAAASDSANAADTPIELETIVHIPFHASTPQ